MKLLWKLYDLIYTLQIIILMCVYRQNILPIASIHDWINQPTGTFHCHLLLLILCPPWKRGHIVLQLLVCRSVDQVLSAQYLLTPSLDQYQTWCRGCPQWVDDPYWFSSHMFKGQGQTTLLSPLCCPLNIFWPLHLTNTKLGARVALNE